MKNAIALVAAALLLSACAAPSVNTPAAEAPTDTAEPMASLSIPTAEPQASPTQEQGMPTGEATQPAATLVPLDLQSDLEAIRLRMLHSHESWHSIWVEVEVTEVPPEGSDMLVRLRRVQIAVRQPAEVLVLRGPQDGEPDYFYVSDGARFLEADLAAGTTQEGEIAPFVLQPFVPPEEITDTINPHPVEGMIGYPAGEMVFPAGLAQRQGTYELIGQDSVAGRAALIVDWTPQPTGLVADRFRIDALTGLILRHQVLGKMGGGERVESDHVMTRIVIDPAFPADLFTVTLPDGLHFMEPPDGG
jgi:hypothetical protein